MRACAAALVLWSGVALADPAVTIPDTYRMDGYRASVPDTVPGAVVVGTEEVRALSASGALLVDVLPAPRRPEAMRPGAPCLPPTHYGLPGSVWWPEIGRGALPDAVETAFRQRLHAAGDRVIVFYCLPNCWMSWNAARRAASMGARAAWYPDGFDGWEAAGLPSAPLVPEPFD